MIGGTPNTATPRPLIIPIKAPAVEQQRDHPYERRVLTAGKKRHEDGSAVQHPRQGKIDAAADDDEGLPDRDDSDECRKDSDRSEMSGREEAGREQAGEEEQRHHAEIGEQDGAVADEHGLHASPRRADLSAIELARTATSRIAPEAIGCQ